MRRLLRWIGIAVVAVLLIVFACGVLLYVPFVQQWAVSKASSYASEHTGMDVRVGRVRLSFPLDLDVRQVIVVDASGDTLVAAGHLLVDLDFAQVLQRRVGIEALELKEVQVDTKEWIASLLLRGRLEALTLYDDLDLQSQLVALSSIEGRGLELDIVLRDTTTAEDTTATSPLEWMVAVEHVALDDARVRVQLADSTLLVFDPTGLQADSVAVDLKREHLAVGMAILSLGTSTLTAAGEMDFDAFATGSDGRLHLGIQGEVTKQELMQYVEPWLPDNVRRGLFSDLRVAYPDTITRVRLNLDGHINHLTLEQTQLTLPGSLHIGVEGALQHLLDTTATMQGRIAVNMQTWDLNWVRRWLGLTSVRLPQMQAVADVTMQGSQYKIGSRVSEGAGTLLLDGNIDTAGDLDYVAKLAVHRLNLNHFLPHDSLGIVGLQLDARGRGTDLLAATTLLDAHMRLTQMNYKHIDLSGMELTAHVAHGLGHTRLTAENELLTAAAEIDALLGKRQTDLTFGVDLSRADLYRLGIADKPLKASMCLHFDGTTNLRDRHRISGSINDIIMLPADTLFRPEDVELEAMLTPDTTHVYLASGDLLLTANGRSGYDRLLEQLGHFTDELSQQMQQRRLDTDGLVHRLPQIDFHLRTGEHNPVHDILKSMGYGFSEARLDLNLDPLVGINGGGHVYRLQAGAMLLDTIRMHAYQDSTGVRLDARVRNSKRNPQISFDARMNAYLLPSGAGVTLTYFDDRGRKGVDLGLQATVEEAGFRLHLDPLQPILAYRSFHLNPDNYIMLGRANRISADLDLLADDGTGLKLYSSPNEEALQDLSVSLNRFNLGELMTVLPYAPRLTGFLQGDAHLIQTTENLSISTDLTVNDMAYEGAYLGQVGLQAVYLPEADGSHFVDGTLMHMGLPVAMFSGSYIPQADDALLDVNATLDRLPFSLADGFFPDAMARLEGVAIGDIHVSGKMSHPVVNGQMCTSGLRLRSDVYSLDLRFQDDTISVEKSKLQLQELRVFSTGKNPFVLDGDLDFADLDRIQLNATLAAKDFELINAKKTAQSVAYGKVYVDLNARMRGTLDNLRLFGRLNVLGNTDVTYVLKDSPLSVEDQLADLVEFVDFEDSTRVVVQEEGRPQHLNITMNVEIDNAARIHCLLSPDASSYVDLEGGGSLMLTYSPEKDMQLNGRYTINSGTMKYTMMVIPLKEFSIKNGSYVEFRGPLMNPTLNLAATERLRTTITENDHPRTVNFDVGMNITQTLENLGLEFTLDAPDDMSLQNEIAAMSAEQRGRVAVTMLATGMYINESGSNGLTGQNALNAFLQSQISNLTGKALKSVDLSFGVEQGTNASGSTQTDYSFRFAKRFWGNRISVIVGGKVSSGSNVQNTGETLIDNVSIEYRLDKSATRYVNLFYDKNYESLMDGEVLEMGGGLVLRRKTNKLGELFLFRKKEK